MSNSTLSRSKAVLIPAMGNLGNKFHSYSFYLNCPAFVPVLSRSTISLLLDKYIEQNLPIYIAVDESLESVFNQELVYYTGKYTLIRLTQTRGINETLKMALNAINESEIIVNVVSSIPEKIVALNEVLIGENEFSHNGYSGVYFEGNNPKFKSKFDINGPASLPFQGIFSATHEAISQALESVTVSEDMIYLVQELHQRISLNFTKTAWFDTGHESNYPSIRKKLITSRSFNRLSFDEQTGILTKSSENTEKLEHEIDYIHQLPWQLQVYYPRIFSFERELGKVHMEYYGYPNLSEYQLYRQITAEQWGTIFTQLSNFILKNLSHKNPFDFEIFWDLLITKTESRVDNFLSDFNHAGIFEREQITINGIRCYNYHSLKDKVHQKVTEMHDSKFHTIMHGDLCFNNILYDVFSETLRLIDPRGSLNAKQIGIYGDVRYDLAKLLHSAVGNYDYMVNNLFDFSMIENSIEFSFPLRENAMNIKEQCERIIRELNIDIRDIYFIMGLLFISMPPMHSDNPKRQLVMYAQGLYFLNQSL